MTDGNSTQPSPGLKIAPSAATAAGSTPGVTEATSSGASHRASYPMPRS